MNFGQALELLKAGFRMRRAGWKGMFVVLQKGYPDGIPINANTSRALGLPEGTVCKFRPYLMFSGSDGSFVPWVTSQTDVLADDWELNPT